MRKISLFCFLGLLIFSFANAQKNGIDYTIHFKTATVVPEPNAQEYLSTYAATQGRSYNSHFFKIIQFLRTPEQSEKVILNNAGIELLDYLPDLAYFAAFTKDIDAKTISYHQVEWKFFL